MENKPASLLVVPLRKALSGIPHLGVVDRWQATAKRARKAHLLLFRGRGINMRLSIKMKYVNYMSNYFLVVSNLYFVIFGGFAVNTALLLIILWRHRNVLFRISNSMEPVSILNQFRF